MTGSIVLTKFLIYASLAVILTPFGFVIFESNPLEGLFIMVLGGCSILLFIAEVNNMD